MLGLQSKFEFQIIMKCSELRMHQNLKWKYFWSSVFTSKCVLLRNIFLNFHYIILGIFCEVSRDHQNKIVLLHNRFQPIVETQHMLRALTWSFYKIRFDTLSIFEFLNSMLISNYPNVPLSCPKIIEYTENYMFCALDNYLLS